MDMSQLKNIHNRFQIVSIVERAALFGGNVWQGFGAPEDRQVFHIVQIYVDIKSDKIIFRTPSIFKINPEMPIFICLSYRNLIFRLLPGEFKVAGDKLICRYPTEARALDERSGDRYVLPFTSDISLSLKRIERTLRESTYELEIRIIDVSQKGFGILISGFNREYLKKHDHFWLKSVDQKPLRHQILGTVCYVAPKGYYLKRGDVRVGLSLSMALNQETFEYLKRKSHLVLTA